jgi:HlyD family secretion protein
MRRVIRQVVWREKEDLPVDLSAMDRPLRRVWLTRSRIVAIAVSLVAVSAATFAYVRYALGRTLTVNAERVVISTVEPGAFHEFIPVTGNIEPRETVLLDAVDGGQVVEVLVEEGAFVKAGQLLVRLNNTHLQLQVINSEAQLSEQLNRLTSTRLLFEQSRLTHQRELVDARFQTGQSRQRLQRMLSMKDEGAIRRADIEDLRLEIERLVQLEAALANASEVDESLQAEQMRQLDLTVAGLKKNLQLARQNLDNLVIRAPFDGQLTTLDAHRGESKRPGQRIGQVDQVDEYKVEALVDEHYVARVTAGQHATVEIAGSTHRLRLARVYPEVRSRQFKVDLTFVERTPSSVRRGQTLQLRLEIGAASTGLVVANGPFFEETGGRWVFVLAASGREAARRPIRLGRRNPDHIEVLNGLAAGERIITSSYESYENVDRIHLRGKTS